MFHNQFNNPIFTHQRSGQHCWLPALIGALGSVAAGGLSMLGQKKQNAANIQASKDMMDYQWKNYGSPAAQLAAYKAIGVNPFASQGLNPQQPQSQIPDQISPVSAGLGFLGQLVEPLQQMANSVIARRQMQMDLINSIYDKDIKAFDLGEIKPTTLAHLKKSLELSDAELKNLQSDLASKSLGRHLTKKQLELIANQILKVQAEKEGIELENWKRSVDANWRQIQFEAGMPMQEYYNLQHQGKNIQANTNKTNQNYRIDKNAESAAQSQQMVWKELEKFRDQIQNFNFEDSLKFLPEPMRKLGAPLIRSVFYMLLNEISSGMTDPLGRISEIMRFVP